MEGQKLKQDGENFRNKLDTKLIFEEWAQKVRSIKSMLVYAAELKMFGS